MSVYFSSVSLLEMIISLICQSLGLIPDELPCGAGEKDRFPVALQGGRRRNVVYAPSVSARHLIYNTEKGNLLCLVRLPREPESVVPASLRKSIVVEQIRNPLCDTQL